MALNIQTELLTLKQFFSNEHVKDFEILFCALNNMDAYILNSIIFDCSPFEIATSNVPSAKIDVDTLKVLRYISSNPGESYQSIGKAITNASKEMANYKYGELRSKLLSLSGFVFEKNGGMFPTPLGIITSSTNDDNALKVMTLACIRIPIVQLLIRSSRFGDVYAPSKLNNFKESTITRRLSSVKKIIWKIDNYLNTDYSKKIHYKQLDSSHKCLENNNVVEKIIDNDDHIIEPLISNKQESDKFNEIIFENTEISIDVNNRPNLIDVLSHDPEEENRNMTINKENSFYTYVSEYMEYCYSNLLFDKEKMIKRIMYTIQNVIEDPDSDSYVRSICNIILGHFVKYFDCSEQEYLKWMYVSKSGLKGIYNYMPYVLINNLENWPLYDCREFLSSSFFELEIKNTAMIETDILSYLSSIEVDFEMEELSKELELCKLNCSILKIKLEKMNPASVDKETTSECNALIAHFPFEIPTGGHETQFCPIFGSDFFSIPECKTIYELIYKGFLFNKLDWNEFKSISASVFDDWRDSISEKMTLGAIISPYHMMVSDEHELGYIFFESYRGLLSSDNYELKSLYESRYEDYCSNNSITALEYYQIMHRTEVIIFDALMNKQYFTLRDYIVNVNDRLLMVCRALDKSTGIVPRYKNRLVIYTGVSGEEYNSAKQFVQHLSMISHDSSLKNRITNKALFEG